MQGPLINILLTGKVIRKLDYSLKPSEALYYRDLNNTQLPFRVPAQGILLFLLNTGKHTRRHPHMADFGFLGRKTSPQTNIATF